MGQRGEEWVSEVRGRRKIGEVRNGRQGETQVGQREVWSGSVASFTGGKQQRSEIEPREGARAYVQAAHGLDCSASVRREACALRVRAAVAEDVACGGTPTRCGASKYSGLH